MPLPHSGEYGSVATDVVGGGPGIVALGADFQGAIGADGKSTPAAWVSADGGGTWHESVVPTATRYDRFWAASARAGVLAAASANGFWYSRDGTVWSEANDGPTFESNTPIQLEAGLGGFISLLNITGSRAAAGWTSTDGTAWHAIPDQRALRDFSAHDLAISNSRAVAVGGGTRPVILVSTDGRTWRRAPVQAALAEAWGGAASVSHVDGRFLLIAPSSGNATGVWTSRDGLSWRQVSLVPAARAWEPDRIVGVAPLGSGWVGAGYRVMGVDDCRPVVWTSADLVHWSRSVLPMVAAQETCYVVEEMIVTAGRAVAVGHAWDMAGGTVPLVWIGSPAH